MKISELAHAIGISEVQRREFRNQIKLLAETGTLIRLRGGRYGLPDEMNLVTGILHGHPNGKTVLKAPKNRNPALKMLYKCQIYYQSISVRGDGYFPDHPIVNADSLIGFLLNRNIVGFFI